MKKLASALSLGTYLSLVSPAFAVSVNTCPVGQFNVLCSFTPTDVVGVLVSTLFIIAIVVALFYLIFGGFKWLTSGGDKGAVQAAREHIIAAIIGLVIIFLSYFILNILLQFFLGVNLGTFTFPTI